MAQAKEASEGHEEAEERRSSSFRVPPDIRRKKITSVMGLLERE